ncbi:MAG: hypothetical protein HY298_05680 [Verrucomicrobia bacterium]|nr:hypothetical protein [Verrucomicrobiota bacterium]
MSRNPETGAPFNLSKWRSVPNRMILVGGVIALLGWILDARQFGFSWLLAYMFCLSFGLGGLFLVLVHHLFDASWSVPIRRFCEHLAGLLFPWMAILFIPLAVLAPKIYPWMQLLARHTPDHALRSKEAFLNLPMFYLVVVFCFVVWKVLTSGLLKWSLKQDETGSAECTNKMRLYSYWGIFAFAITLTLMAIMLVKALEHEWFSTMYGVYYFADSVWATLAVVYVITAILQRNGQLRDVVHADTFYYIGSLLFAFTVFYAYIHFAQYFIIWNANMPEETFHYVLREAGIWWWVGQIIIFGHFFVPFLLLLRIDVKLKFWFMIPLGTWVLLMRFFDQWFNTGAVVHPEGFLINHAVQWSSLAWDLLLDAGCIAFISGVLIKVFLNSFHAHPPYPLRDPRMAESLGVYVPPAAGSRAASHGGAK